MKTIAPNLNGQGLKIGIVQARFTNEVGSAMVEAARKNCWNWAWQMMTSHWRPCPARWKCRWCCKTWRQAKSYDALIAIGAVIAAKRII